MDIINLYAIESMHALRNQEEYIRQIEHRYVVRDKARRARRAHRQRIWQLLRSRGLRPSGVATTQVGGPVARPNDRRHRQIGTRSDVAIEA